MIEIITFAGTFTNTSKNRITAMFDSNITDQLHHVNGFTNTSTTKQANFTTFSKWTNQINNFNTSFE